MAQIVSSIPQQIPTSDDSSDDDFDDRYDSGPGYGFIASVASFESFNAPSCPKSNFSFYLK